MLVLLDVKLSLIPMEDGEHTEVELSLERIPQRLIVPLLMLHVGVLSPLLRVDSVSVPLYNFPMLLVFHTHFLYLLTHMELLLRDTLMLNSLKLLTRTSTFVLDVLFVI